MGEQVDQEDAMEGFVSRALRRKQPGSYEQLLCQHLIKSVGSEPIEKIRLVSEAAMMVPDTPVDTDILDAVYRVATAFTEARRDIKDPYDTRMWHGVIPWPFLENDENFEKYIRPWALGPHRMYHRGFDRYGDNEIQEEYENASKQERFWIISERIHIAGLVNMEARFLSWAMPRTMEMFEKLSKLISPDLYETMLEKMKI